MTKLSFCAVTAQQSGEDPIGTAEHYQTYVLIECPYPWSADVFESPQIPIALRHLIAAASKQKSVRFLCINRPKKAGDHDKQSTRLLIYDAINPVSTQTPSARGSSPHENNLQKVNSERLSSYRGVEFVLDGLGQVAHCLQSYWEGVSFGKPIIHIKDVLVCTHGMRDKCCARFGQPFFKAAERLETKPAFKDVRVWRVSHIGGHRFAPTAIVLPEGRYYAHLTLAALRALLTRSGEVSQLQPMYRGWGLLPKSLQVVERQLLLQIGWPWLDYRLSYRVISEEKKSVRAVLLTEFTESSGKMLTTYQVRVVKSRNDAHRIHTSCNDQCPFVPIQYAIADLSILTTQQHNRSPATTQPSQVCIPADTPVSKSGE